MTPEDQRFEALREALAAWRTRRSGTTFHGLYVAARERGYPFGKPMLGSQGLLVEWARATLAAHDQAKESGG